VRMLYAAKAIHVGDHPTISLFGLTVNLDILMSTLLAAAIFLFLAWRVTRSATSGVPTKLQVAYEAIIGMVTDLADSAVGPKGRKFVPIGVTLFIFILICNWIGFLPSAMQPGVSGEILPSPTSDINLPLAMAAIVIIWVHIESFRARGVGGYFKHYAQPFAALAPINIVEEITKPITMTFRLFGNMFAGHLLLLLFTLGGQYMLKSAAFVKVFAILSFGLAIGLSFFEMGIECLQAYIFTLLAALYIAGALAEEH